MDTNTFLQMKTSNQRVSTKTGVILHEKSIFHGKCIRVRNRATNGVIKEAGCVLKYGRDKIVQPRTQKYRKVWNLLQTRSAVLNKVISSRRQMF